MRAVGIVANGPKNHLPDLKQYENIIDVWIGADLGALTLAENGIQIGYAVGDFDSINSDQKQRLKNLTAEFHEYPEEKDETDLEIALSKALEKAPEEIYLFGVTGGRIDHALVNIQLLHTIKLNHAHGVIIDRWNMVELTCAGTHTVTKNNLHPYISFVPFTDHVDCLSLKGFYYPLEEASISWGSTLCISNRLLSDEGTFTYKKGMLLMIRSRDADEL